MNKKAFTLIRILLGVFMIVFGLNKLYPFIPAEQPEGAVAQYFNALIISKTMFLVAAIEILAGISFILNKYGALMAVILMSVAVNAVLVHIYLAPETIIGALIFLILNSLVLYGYKDRYKDILKP